MLRGSLILHRRIEVLHRSAAHIAAVIDFIVRPSAMHRASVVPHDEIAWRPFVRMDELRLRCVFHQLMDQHAAVRKRLIDDVGSVRGKIQRLATGPRMDADQSAMYRRVGATLFLRELRKSQLAA